MSDELKIVEVICPTCRTIGETALESAEPQPGVVVEIPCESCLEKNEELSMEPVFRDKHGLRLVIYEPLIRMKPA